MADSKVILEVIVEGKNVKVVQKDVENLAKSTNKAAKGLEETSDSARTTDRVLKGTSKQSSNATKNFSKMSQGIAGGLVPAYATLAANIFAVTAAFNFLKRAGDLVTLQRGQEAYAAATGTALRTLTSDIVAATDAQIKFTDASQAAAIGTAAGLSPDQLVRLGTAAKDVSIILGRDVTDSFNRLIRGVTKAEPELLDELGIVLRLKDATDAYAQSLGKNANELTAFERSQAVANDVLAQAESKYGRILAVVQPQTNEFNKLGVAFDNLLNKIKEFSAIVAGPFANAITQFPALGVAILGLFGKGVLLAALPGLQQIGDNAKEAAETSKMKFEEAKLSLKAYTEEIKRTNTALGSLEKQAAARKIQKLASNPATDPGFGKDASFNLFKEGRGNELTARQLAGIKTAIAKTAKITDATIKQAYIGALDTMLDETKKTTRSIETSFLTLGQRVQIIGKGMVATWTGAMAKMRAATVALTSAVSSILSLFGWVSLIVTLGVAAYQFFKAKEAADETSKALEYQSGKIAALNEEFKNFNEVQDIITEGGQAMLQYFTALGTRIGQLNLSSLSETFALAFDTSSFDAFQAKADKAIKRLNGEGFFAQYFGNLQKSRLEKDFDRVSRQLDSAIAGGASSQDIDTLKNNLAFIEDQLAEVSDQIDLAQANFGNFLNLSDDQRLRQLGQYFTDQAAALDTLSKNFGGEGSKAIIAYLNKIEEFLAAPLDTGIANSLLEELKALQPAVAEATNLFNSYKKAREDNIRLVGQISTSFLQPSQESQAITQLEEEISLTEKLRTEMSGLTEEQKTRLTEAKQALTFVTLLNNLEQERADREQSIAIDREKRLRGTTKLQAALIELQLEQQKIESDRKSLLDEQNIVLSRIRVNKGIITREDRDKLYLLQQQLDLLREQEIKLERQGNLTAQLVDTINQAFEDGLQSGLEDLITGKETSLKNAIAKLSLSILTGMASTFAKQLTEGITQIKFTNRLQQAFEYGADLVEKAIKRGFGEETTSMPTSTEGPKGMLSKAKEFLIGSESTPKIGNYQVVEGVATQVGQYEEAGDSVLKGGIFSEFINSLNGLFSEDAPFLEKLGAVFSGAGSIFVNTFNSIISLFTTSQTTAATSASTAMGTAITTATTTAGGTAAAAMGTAITTAGAAAATQIAGAIVAANAASAGVGFIGAANGGIMPGGFKAFASGGVVDQPTFGLVGEGRYNEAIVPLPDGKAIPVQMTGGSSQQNNVTVNVSIDGQGNGNVQTQGQDLTNLGNVIARAVQQELQNQKRSGGILNPYGAA